MAHYWAPLHISSVYLNPTKNIIKSRQGQQEDFWHLEDLGEDVKTKNTSDFSRKTIEKKTTSPAEATFFQFIFWLPYFCVFQRWWKHIHNSWLFSNIYYLYFWTSKWGGFKPYSPATTIYNIYLGLSPHSANGQPLDFSGLDIFSQKHLWCLGSRLVAETAWERYGGDESADGTVTILPRRICGRCCYHAICSCWGAAGGERDYRDESADAAVGVEVLGSETEETNLRTVLLPCYLKLLGERDYRDESADAAVGVEVLGRSETAETNLRTVLLPCYLQLLGWRCWGARLPRRICGRCCYHAICSCWGGGAGERDGGDESADAAVAMLFAAVGAGAGERYEGHESADAAVTMLFAAAGWSCWEAIRRRQICGRCCYHAIWSCWGGAAGERYGRDDSADGAVAMLFAAVGVEVQTAETNLRTVLLPCYLQLLGWRCWGAIRRRRICGRCCCHAICSCWGAAAGERDGGDESAGCHAICSCWGGGAGERYEGHESADGAVPCYLGAGAGERYGGDESADAAVTMLFGTNVGVVLLGKRYGGDESADGAVTMLFAAVGVQLLGSDAEDTNLRTVLLPCYLQLLGCSCWGAIRGDESADAAVMLYRSDTEETNLRTLLLPCYLQLLGCSCWGARRRRRICGRCCYHAIWSCWGGGAGEQDCRDESADGAVTMLFAAVGVQLLGSDAEDANLRTLLLPCYLQLLGCSCWGALRRRRICGRCCYHARSDTEETNLRTLLLPCYLQLLGCSCCKTETEETNLRTLLLPIFAAVGVELLGSETEEMNLRTLLLPCYLAVGVELLGQRYGGDESADSAVAVLFAAVGVQLLGSDTEETNLRTLLLPCYLQLLGRSCWGAIRRRRICGRCCYHAICRCWGAAAGERDCGDECCGRCCYHANWGFGSEETELRTVVVEEVAV